MREVWTAMMALTNGRPGRGRAALPGALNLALTLALTPALALGLAVAPPRGPALAAGAAPRRPAPAPKSAPAPGAAKTAGGVAPGLGASNAPIDISADESELLNAQRLQIWRGNVEAIQGEDRLRTPELQVFYAQRNAPAGGGKAPPSTAGASFGSIERMEAAGPVYYVTPSQNAKGDHATYVAATNVITMTGNVVLVQDKNVATGARLTIDRNTNHATLYQDTGRRVRAVVYPNNQTPAAGPERPAAPALPRS